MHDAASPSPDWDLLHFCMCITHMRLKYASDTAFLKEILSNLYAPKVLFWFFLKYFPSPHSPQAFRVIFLEAEIHTSPKEHSICSTVRSPPVAVSALARRKPHGPCPSRFFLFLLYNLQRQNSFGGGGREGSETEPCPPPPQISGL